VASGSTWPAADALLQLLWQWVGRGSPSTGHPPTQPLRQPLTLPHHHHPHHTNNSNYGFDPLGLSKNPDGLRRFKESEVIHCRWAMLGAAGCLGVEALGQGNWYDAPLWVSGSGAARVLVARVNRAHGGGGQQQALHRRHVRACLDQQQLPLQQARANTRLVPCVLCHG
jgi:hypothetical protein